jgi:dUTPase
MPQQPPRIAFELVHANATLPRRSTPGSAGYDLASCEAALIPAGTRKLVDTGVRVLIGGAYPPRRGEETQKPGGDGGGGEETQTPGGEGQAEGGGGGGDGKAEGEGAVDVDVEVYGRIAPRSGLAVRGIDVAAGVCDADYRGNYKVLLVNNNAPGPDVQPFEVKVGDRIAQLVFEAIVHVPLLLADEHVRDVRGAGGFGSTGR